MASSYVIYGANGYTGALTARMAAARGHRPILAGRSALEVERLARELGLESRVFALDDPRKVDAGLEGITVVLHCAGPFSRTAKPMAEACLRRKVHYLDITGEAEVFESLAARDAQARSAGVMLLPGSGFDVVPSDCLAAHLKRRLPTACRLTLGFQARGRLSRGTATTMAENFHRGGLVRRGGALTPVPAAWKTRTIDFGRGPVTAMTIPWGDVATAFHSTGIPDIEVYTAVPTALRVAARLSRYVRPILASGPVQRALKARIRSGAPGPTDAERAGGRCFLWGEVEDDSGRRAVSRLQTPEGYTTTALASLAIVERVLAGEARPGFQTPSRACGPDFVLGLEGVNRTDA
jgi:short subunit dehydrogenase-like uncharacterized protein